MSLGQVHGFLLSRRLGFVVQRDHFVPEGRLQIFLALRSSGRVEIFCPEGRRVSSKSPEGQKISTLPLDRSAKKISSRPEGTKWSLWTTKPNLRGKTILVPAQGTQNLLGFLEIMKKLNCQRQTKSAKKLAKAENVPGADAIIVWKIFRRLFSFRSRLAQLYYRLPSQIQCFIQILMLSFWSDLFISG